MCVVDNCCFCISLRTGGIIIAVFNLLHCLNLIGYALYCVTNESTRDRPSKYHYEVTTSSSLLLHGGSKTTFEIGVFLLVWGIIDLVAVVLLFIGIFQDDSKKILSGAVMMVITAIVTFLIDPSYVFLHIGAFFTYVTSFMLLIIYFAVVLYSLAQEV